MLFDGVVVSFLLSEWCIISVIIYKVCGNNLNKSCLDKLVCIGCVG